MNVFFIKIKSILTISIILFSVSNSIAQSEKNLANNFLTDTSKNDFHFPAKTEIDSPFFVGFNGGTNDWYSDMLTALQEPVLYDTASNKNSYRFLWLRTFHHPISVRIEKEESSCKVYWKMCSGQAGYSAGNLILTKEKIVEINDWKTISKQLSNANFWNLPSENDNDGLDGAMWIFEAATQEYYHVVSRWCAKDEDKIFARCCLYLLSLTDEDFKSEKIY